MADVEDKEKAEKVAAARKRYEQLKKQKAKKSRKEKDDKTDQIEATEGTQDAADDGKAEDAAAEEDETPKTADGVDDAAAETEPGAESAHTTAEELGGDNTEKPEVSLSLESRMRSASFKRNTSQPDPVSLELRLPAISPGGDAVTEIYRKQSARIEQLERESKRLEREAEERERALRKAEDETEELREAQVEVADLKFKAGKVTEMEAELEKLKAEISSLQRQNSQLQSQAKDSKRRASSIASPIGSEDLSAQLAAKMNTLETLELEVSNLRHSLSVSQFEVGDMTARLSSLEASLQSAEASSVAAQEELASLRSTSAAASAAITSSDSDTGTSSDADANRIRLLTSDLAAAQKAATDAAVRATTLEKKIDAITNLHRESEARNQTQAAGRAKELERLRTEATEMRSKVAKVSSDNARLRAGLSTSVGSDADGVNDDATKRIRELEAEITELRRGIWRDRRTEMQGEGMEGAEDEGMRSPQRSVYDDVDLDSPAPRGMASRTTSSPYGAFSSVISAFTGGGSTGAGRRQSMRQQISAGFLGVGQGNGLLEGEIEDDLDFDEDAFRAAQEEEARKRLERVKEVKRGLKDWKGWRVDMVQVRGGVAAAVFDV